MERKTSCDPGQAQGRTGCACHTRWWAALALALALVVCIPKPVRAGYGGEGPSAAESAWVRRHVGMYAWGPGREEEWMGWDRDALSDMAARLGTRIIRSHLGMFPEPWRLEYDPTAPTYADRLSRPEWRALIARHDVIFLTLADGSGKQFDPEWTREHLRRLTTYLLRTYADTPKTFVLGLWECDHWLTEESMARDPALVRGYTRFFQARHDGIAAGRAQVPWSRSRVLEMIELVTLDFDGKGCLVNRVVPATRADLYSLSSWRYQYELERALNYIASKAPRSPTFGSRHCMIGEAGGPANWAPPHERIEKTRSILQQARRWGVPYVTWWELVGGIGEGQVSLRTPPYEEGMKLAPYYWFYRAYHDADDPLTIESFEEDPYGPPGGDVSEEGFSLNLLGGRRQTEGSVAACLVPGDAPGQRSLFLRFGSGGGRWSTSLMHLDARRFSELRLAVRGQGVIRVALRDAQGREASVPLPPGAREAVWRTHRVALRRFTGINQAGLAALLVSARPGTRARVDQIQFATSRAPLAALQSGGDRAPSPQRAGAADAPPGAAHLALRAPDQPLILPDGENGRLTRVRVRTAAAARLPNPALTDGRTTLPLARELLPGEVLDLFPGGTSHLRYGPLGPLLDVRQPDAAGLLTHNLVGHPQFHSLQPGGDGRDCWLEWEWESPHPVRHFRIALYGNVRANCAARVAILTRGDGRDWQAAALEERSWDEGWWVGRPPAGFQPARNLRVRLQLFPDLQQPDWPWTIGLSDVRIDLWLDTGECQAPLAAGLRYRDGGPARSYRGLLDLSWERHR